MPVEAARPRPVRILVLNPNSSKSMTEGLIPVINSVDLGPGVEVHTFTAPAPAPASINNAEDIAASLAPALNQVVDDDCYQWDGILVACFSVHPLLQAFADRALGPATGIFEAGVRAATMLTSHQRNGRWGDRWGIVTTGKFWEEHLRRGVVCELTGDPDTPLGPKSRFAGVESTGLNASDFHHGVDPAVVTEKIKDATKRLLTRSTTRVTCIVMGCAGMAGLEDTIRSAASEVYDDRFAYGILHVVDGVRAGLVQINQMIKDERLRPKRLKDYDYWLN
ncbi:uncharacterized protein PG998_012901 [Apiospora kogelbergensis]|uniref:uncharacterized protein n=1 Tax=Apiospora kogelbergensis TaxID=1337665 RepID=UPI00312EDF8E